MKGEKNWAVLWQHAIPLVKLAIKKSTRRGAIAREDADDDLLQQGMLIAGEAIRTWNPFECAFSTHIVWRVRGDLFNYCTERSRGGVGSYKQRPVVLSTSDTREDAALAGDEDDGDDKGDDGTFEATLTYEGVRKPSGQYDGISNAPEGYGDIPEEADKASLDEAVRAAVALLPSKQRELVEALAGLNGTLMTVEQYADRERITTRAAFFRLAAARKVLSANLPNFRH